jgi:hypothetical protein
LHSTLQFKEFKSRFRLDKIKTTKPYIIEALIIMATISLMTSREIVDEVHKLDAQRREAADADCRRRGFSLVVVPIS